MRQAALTLSQPGEISAVARKWRSRTFVTVNLWALSADRWRSQQPCRQEFLLSVAPVAYQVVLEPGIGQFREFEPRRMHTRINSLGLFLVHKLTCGKRESVS